MKINILSDLHLEFQPLDHVPPPCDLAILAGDLAPGTEGATWATNTYGPHEVAVLSVAGNHEFYGHRQVAKEYEALRWSNQGRMSFLQNETVVLDGVRFVGATLWTDYNLYGTPLESRFDAAAGIADYEQIMFDEFRHVATADLCREFRASVSYLEDVLRLPFDGQTVVITHHAPTERSVAERYIGDRLTPAFASNLEWLMELYRPALWVHGHMHYSVDIKVGATRVVCNPRGYPMVDGVENPAFDPNFVVEI